MLFSSKSKHLSKKMCGDRLANFLSVPTAHSFRRASVGSRTGAVQSWQSARLASLRRRGFSLQSTHGPPKKHPTALAVGCFFVPLTQSGCFLQNSMAGMNPCWNSRCGIYKCYCPSNCSVICLKKIADHRSRDALSRMKLRTSSLAEA